MACLINTFVTKFSFMHCELTKDEVREHDEQIRRKILDAEFSE